MIKIRHLLLLILEFELIERKILEYSWGENLSPDGWHQITIYLDFNAICWQNTIQDDKW